MKKNTLKIIAATGACAMALTLLPAGSAQAAATYLPTKEVRYSYSEDGKWEKYYSESTSYNKKGAVVKNVTTRFDSDGKEVSTTKYSYKGSKLIGEKTYLNKELMYKMNVSYKKGLPRIVKAKHYFFAKPTSSKTVFKYKGKLPVTVSFYYGKDKVNYWKNKYKKGKLISRSYYSAGGTIRRKDIYKNGDLVKSVDYATPKTVKKYSYKNHKLVKSVEKEDDSITTIIYNNKGLPEKETVKDSSSVETTTYSYKYYKNNTVMESLSQWVDPNDPENIRKEKIVYSGFKKFKSTPAHSIVEDYPGRIY